VSRLDAALVRRLYQRAGASAWDVGVKRFARALERSAERRFGTSHASEGEVAAFVESLHLADLALACACDDGHEAAWNHFITRLRPSLYAAAGAIAGVSGARELADSVYADLYGVRGARGERRTLFAYFDGRSSLITWVRAIVARTHVDEFRAQRRLEPLPDPAEEPRSLERVVQEPVDLDRRRFADALRTAFAAAVAGLHPEDRLRLAYYYTHELTLAQIGRVMREHEATVSRKLERARRRIREGVVGELARAGFTAAEVAERMAALAEVDLSVDLSGMLGVASRDGVAVPGKRGSSGDT
jgi:RNA polymerase sigma-70 factor (ECF subfamily)